MRVSLYQPGVKGEFLTFSVSTRGQRRKPFGYTEISNKPAKKNNIIKHSKIQTRIWPPTLNTESHVHPNHSIKFGIKSYTD
jgi:hypothetical protein